MACFGEFSELLFLKQTTMYMLLTAGIFVSKFIQKQTINLIT